MAHGVKAKKYKIERLKQGETQKGIKNFSIAALTLFGSGPNQKSWILHW